MQRNSLPIHLRLQQGCPGRGRHFLGSERGQDGLGSSYPRSPGGTAGAFVCWAPLPRCHPSMVPAGPHLQTEADLTSSPVLCRLLSAFPSPKQTLSRASLLSRVLSVFETVSLQSENLIWFNMKTPGFSLVKPPVRQACPRLQMALEAMATTRLSPGHFSPLPAPSRWHLGSCRAATRVEEG